MSNRFSFFEEWVIPIKGARVYDFQKDRLYLNQQSIKPVTLTVPAWVHADMDQVCETCGWPIYSMKIGTRYYQFCVNPECVHCQSYSYIETSLNHEDRMKRERRERIAKRKAEKASKEEADRREELRIENAVRRMFYSFGIRIRKTPKKRRARKT